MSVRPVDDKRSRCPAACFAAMAATLALAACGGPARADDPPPLPTPVPPAAPSGLDAVVALARADVARRSGLPEDSIGIESAEVVIWPDGSLGCPEPDLLYTQALVPGYRVVLRAGGVRYDYHASRRGEPSLCPEGRAQSPLPDASR